MAADSAGYWLRSGYRKWWLVTPLSVDRIGIKGFQFFGSRSSVEVSFYHEAFLVHRKNYEFVIVCHAFDSFSDVQSAFKVISSLKYEKG